MTTTLHNPHRRRSPAEIEVDHAFAEVFAGLAPLERRRARLDAHIRTARARARALEAHSGLG
jgi:hypothetical protein